MYRFSRSGKVRLICIVLCPNIVQITMCFFVTPLHRCVIMHEVNAYKILSYTAQFDTTLRNKCDCKSWNAQIEKSLRQNMSLSTECAAALLLVTLGYYLTCRRWSINAWRNESETHHYNMFNHKNNNFLDCDWFKKLLFSTYSLAKLLSDSLLSDSSISQSHSKL